MERNTATMLQPSNGAALWIAFGCRHLMLEGHRTREATRLYGRAAADVERYWTIVAS